MRVAHDIPELIKLGYKQVSAKYRTVARLPEGKSGKDALYEAEMAVLAEDGDLADEILAYWRKEKKRWVDGLGERVAADHFRRVHAHAAGLWLELTPTEFSAFKAQGGKTA